MYCLFNCEVGLADKYGSVSNLCAFGRRKITLLIKCYYYFSKCSVHANLKLRKLAHKSRFLERYYSFNSLNQKVSSRFGLDWYLIYPLPKFQIQTRRFQILSLPLVGPIQFLSHGYFVYGDRCFWEWTVSSEKNPPKKASSYFERFLAIY